MKHNFEFTEPKIAFHIYDHDEEETFQIVGKSNFMRWLNDHADQQRYSFFSTHEKLKQFLGEEDDDS
tara:strand:+ start:293 stop:493 length:201 start_codon:yes stop_codon:yes gene_type:complete